MKRFVALAFSILLMTAPTAYPADPILNETLIPNGLPFFSPDEALPDAPMLVPPRPPERFGSTPVLLMADKGRNSHPCPYKAHRLSHSLEMDSAVAGTLVIASSS